MAVYDAFYFVDEFDLLDLRQRELEGVVDYFVLQEATVSHSKKPKRLHYLEDENGRFDDISHKVIHWVVRDTPPELEVWDTYHWQRERLQRALDGRLVPGDVVLSGAVDEIPRADVVRRLVTEAQVGQVYGFEQKFYYYYLNCRVTSHRWVGTRLFRYAGHDYSFVAQRDRGEPDVISDAGWHFSHLGDERQIARKIALSLHTEWDHDRYKDPAHIRACMEEGKDLYNRTDMAFAFEPVDASYPRDVLARLDHYLPYIFRPYDFLNWRELCPPDASC
jgi:beta-1,4-mannosyl-glycoprotein beta-1,4-N-acetylglucosaminyltransferase